MKLTFNIVNFIIYLILVTWALILVIVPFGAEPNTIDFGDDGVTTFLEHSDEIEENTDNDFVESIYDSGDSMCHQKASRSLFVNGNQMPYCARDVALFWGFAIGVGVVTLVRIELKWWWLVGGLVPMGIDGGVQLFTDYESTNILRVITGGSAGIVTGFAIGVIVYELTEVVKYERARKKYQKEQQEMLDEQTRREKPVLNKAFKKNDKNKR